jgi:hypothetical protein
MENARWRSLAMSRSGTDGTPIEEAPFWILLIATPLIGAVLFLGAVGFQDTLGVWHGQWKPTALGALAAAAILIGTLSRLKSWRRPKPGEPDTRPRVVRFATWLLGTAAFAFVLEGVLALIWADHHPGPLGVAYVMVVIAGARGLLAWSERFKKSRK